jgi:hypothetical protein
MRDQSLTVVAIRQGGHNCRPTHTLSLRQLNTFCNRHFRTLSRVLVAFAFSVILLLFMFIFVFVMFLFLFWGFLGFGFVYRSLYTVGPSSPHGAQLNVRGGGFPL